MLLRVSRFPWINYCQQLRRRIEGQASLLTSGKKAEELVCKSLLGPAYAHLEEAECRVQYVDYRKASTNRKRRLRQQELDRSDPFLSSEYLEHLETPQYKLLRDMCFAAKDCLCAGCGKPAVECHHNRYRKEVWGTLEELKDMTPVCRQCHKQMDKRRRDER